MYPQSMFPSIIRKNVYPGKPQFYYIKVGCKGVFVLRTCFRDERLASTTVVSDSAIVLNRTGYIAKFFFNPNRKKHMLR